MVRACEFHLAQRPEVCCFPVSVAGVDSITMSNSNNITTAGDKESALLGAGTGFGGPRVHRNVSADGPAVRNKKILRT